MKASVKKLNIADARVLERETRRPLPAHSKKVAGMLRGRRKLLEKHVQAVREEWR